MTTQRDQDEVQPFEQLTAEKYLNGFVEQAAKMAKEVSCSNNVQEFIQRIVLSSSDSLEESYRDQLDISGPLTNDQYAELIVKLKNSIGGDFSVTEITDERISLRANRCPFGDTVKKTPALCQMTSSIFGGIAARNYGYAKVELKKQIALGSSHCEICIHKDPSLSETIDGNEYFSDGHQVISEIRAPSDVQKRIEKRLHEFWKREQTEKHVNNHKNIPKLVAQSPTMLKLLSSIETVAPTNVTVLLSGETGVGKEVMAKAIHCMSSRIHKPFIAVNCGSIPSELVESELFGHETGAFTDAKKRKLGKFERANGGTLFLDEVDSLSPRAQTSLLRVLQEQQFERVGGQATISCDVRVIAATNANLMELSNKNQFRKDLFYRLNVISLVIPPLRERRDDIPALTEALLERFQQRYFLEKRSISNFGMQLLRHHPWEGNVRELENVLERSYLFAQNGIIEQILFDVNPKSNDDDLSGDVDLKALKQKAADEAEKQVLSKVLVNYKGKISKVAESTGLSVRAIYQKIKQHQLYIDDYK